MPRNPRPPRWSPRTTRSRSTIRWPKPPAATDPFDEIDFGSFFDDYLDPGYKSPASESVEKPSFETFLSSPVTLGDHLRSQLSVSIISDEARDAAESIIGNLDEDGYLSASLEEIASIGEHTPEQVEEAIARGAVARPGRRGRAQPARVPAAADRERQRAWRRGLADRLQSPPPDGDPAVQGNRQGAGASDRAHRDRRAHDPAPESAARACAIPARARAWWSRTSSSPRTATITSSR